MTQLTHARDLVRHRQAPTDHARDVPAPEPRRAEPRRPRPHRAPGAMRQAVAESPAVHATAPFTVASTAVLHGLIGLASGVLAVLFAVAGLGTGQTWRWVVAVVFLALAAGFTSAAFVRPTLAADRTGIRMRLGGDWIGAPWDEIESVTVFRRHWASDGRIAVHLRDPGPVVARMSPQLRRLTDANRRLTGSSLAVSYGIGMRPSATDVAGTLREYAAGRCLVAVQD